jgi:hypothetical protein
MWQVKNDGTLTGTFYDEKQTENISYLVYEGKWHHSTTNGYYCFPVRKYDDDFLSNHLPVTTKW